MNDSTHGPPPPENPQRILIVVLPALGDVLLATGLIAAVKRRYPQAGIDVVLRAGQAGILAGNPDVAAVIEHERRPGRRLSLRYLTCLFRRYDLAISAATVDRAALICLAAAAYRVGVIPARGRGRWWKTRLFQRWFTADNSLHTVRQNQAIADLLDLGMASPLVAPTSSEGKQAVTQALGPEWQTQRYAVLHPTPAVPVKRWPASAWAELADWLVQKGYRVVVTGGPGDSEADYLDKLRAGFRSPADWLPGRLSLADMSTLLGQAAVYVGVDTLVSHLAAANGTPCITLFGPTDPAKWAPWPQGQDTRQNPFARQGSDKVGNVTVVQGNGDCVPCLKSGCLNRWDSYSRCLDELSAARVISATAAAIDEPVTR